MELKFWGVRGSIASPLSSKEIKDKIKRCLILSRNVDISTEEKLDFFLNQLPLSINGTIGGNTSCVSIEENNTLLVFDMGSGIKYLGEELMSKYPQGKEINIFLSHTHWDHILGLPFFLPLYSNNFTLNFYSPKPDIYDRLVLQQKQEFFPVSLDQTPSKKVFKKIHEKDSFNINRIFN